MTGYSPDFSMSNNAIAAYAEGLVPASKIRGVPAALVERHCRAAEWHHSSKAYNRVNFYDPDLVRAAFGLDHDHVCDAECEHGCSYRADPAAIAALAAHKNDRKAAAAVHENCTVEWIDWIGSLRRPKAIERREAGCTVTVKGQTATITLPNGSTLTKRLSTRGFSFTKA